MKNQIIINGSLIFFRQLQKKEKLNLILLHGWRSDSSIWKNLISKLYNANVSIYALDLPGFGSSPPPTKTFNLQDYANLITGFIKIRKLNNVILLGHSFGGRIGIKIASTTPCSIDRLILVDSAGFVSKSNKVAAYGKIAKLVKPLFKPKFMKNIRTNIYKRIGADDYISTPNMQKTFLNVINEDLTSNLNRISKSTLIIWGENDKDTPPEFAKMMNKMIAESELFIIENAGHYSFLDKPNLFYTKIQEFIKK